MIKLVLPDRTVKFLRSLVHLCSLKDVDAQMHEGLLGHHRVAEQNHMASGPKSRKPQFLPANVNKLINLLN
jgi:hypothetical protein